ncbi:restriction endonuclease subunit S [Myroides marinus]|uniref:restriction endonuclease subunit S n=1 Tax=Myroides marinus TaxID=703342 RepID=UPI002575B060|nr:restriction endonuclease subunit S [Myroides marinus]MDM1381943.1 restriction endonuclease subunit S [Myroides marinus]
MEQNKKVPAIRFNGFEDEWEEKKLGNIVYRLDNLRKPVKASERISGNIPYYGANGIQDFVDGYTHDGEFVLLAEDGANDLKKYPIQYVKGKIWVNNHAHVIQGIVGEVENLFLKNTLLKTDFEQIIVGGSRSKLNATTMMNIKINSAKTLTEQAQIGNFFKTLDSQINAQEQKHQKLINLKKAMLEKMFPKEGADVPEIRFKGFTEKWEPFYIKDICSISTGKSNTQDKIDNGIYPFYVRSATIERSNRYLYNEEAVLTVGDGVGTGKVFHYVNGKFDLHQRVYRMYNFNNIKGKFFYYIFSKEFYKRVMSMTAKTSVDSVRLEMIADMSILIPTNEEQIMIIDFLENYDNQINNIEAKIEKHKNIKQALLQKMFV